MSSPALVSVIVPALNAAATIAASLRSALAQSHRHLEVIVVDDGSTDATAAIVSRLAEEDPRVRLISGEHQGPAHARNRAIAAAAGTWLAPLDADDLWHPEKIARQLEAGERGSGEIGFVYCLHYLIDEADRVIAAPDPLLCRGRVFHRLFFRNFVGSGSVPLFRREAVRRVGGYAAAGYSEDAFLQLRVAEFYPVENVPLRLVGYRVHPGSISRRDDALERWIETRRIFFERWPHLPPFLRGWVEASGWRLLAERRAWQRRYGGAMRALARAFVLDPRGVTRFLGGRVRGSLRRRFGPRIDAGGPGCDFSVAPVEIAPSPSARPGSGAARLDAQRLEALRQLDQQMAFACQIGPGSEMEQS